MLLQQALLPQTTACMGCVPSVMEKAIVAAANGDAQAVAAWLDEGGGVDTTYGRLCLCTQLMDGVVVRPRNIL